MGILSRTIFREIATSAVLGTTLFAFVLFLQKLGRLFEILVRSSASWPTVGYLFALVIPPTLTFAVPVGVLVGVLLALNRMSTDGEIIGMRAAGIPTRRILYPVLAFAMLAMSIAASATLWLTPLSIRETYRVVNQLVAEQLTAEIQPRIFEESFPNRVLYVGDVVAGPTVRWRNVFMADLTPAAQRSGGGRDYGDQPGVITASQAIAATDADNSRIQLSLRDGYTHDAGRAASEYYSSSFPNGEQVLQAQVRATEEARAFTSMDTGPLFAAARDSVEARIELHQRLALPFACLLLAVVGVPLGASTRKSGRSAAFVLTVFVAFVYWIGLIGLIGMAKQEKLPVIVATWAPNTVLALLGIVLVFRLERTGEHDLFAPLRNAVSGLYDRFRGTLPSGPSGMSGRGRIPILPQIVDTYVLTSFLFYFGVLLVSFVALIHIFTFFELLSDIVENQTTMSRVLTYHLFLSPQLIYDTAPFAVLVGVLVTFGALGKHNEVIAMRACGVSLYRLAAPVLITSMMLSAALFAIDHYYVPGANRIQDGIRNEIKGRPIQTYLRPDRKWVFGQGSRIYYYRYFDPSRSLMVGPSIYELDPTTFRLTRHISAESARWEPSLGTWILQNGWSRELDGARTVSFEDFSGQARTFNQLDEPPSYFLKEVKQDEQMNFAELRAYVDELRQSGFDTARLRVQLHKKLSVPLFALIMATLSVPFAFLAGNRGAMAGVGVSLGIAIAYVAVNQLFEQIGNLNQLPAAMAAWSPDAVFGLAGVYLFTRMRT